MLSSMLSRLGIKDPQAQPLQPQQPQSDPNSQVEHLLKHPPCWQEAQIHGIQSLMTLNQESLPQYDPAISLKKMHQLQQNRVPLCYNLSKVRLISSGIPLFFKMKSQLIYILVLLLFPSICEITLNTFQDQASQYFNPPASEVTFSLGNFGKTENITDPRTQDQLYYQSYMNVITILIIWALLLLFSYEQKMVGIEIDERNVTASDYAILLEGFPPRFMDIHKLLIQDYIDTLFKEQTVHSICEIYKVGNLVRFQREYDDLDTKFRIRDAINKRYLGSEKNQKKLVIYEHERNQKKKCCRKSVSEDIQLQRLKIKGTDQIKRMQRASKFIVVFKKEESVNQLNSNWKDSLLYGLIVLTCPKCLVCKKKNPPKIYSHLFFKEKKNCCCKYRLTWRRAPQPSDIYWENLDVKACDKWKKTFITFLVAVLILSLSFVISIVFKELKQYVLDKYDLRPRQPLPSQFQFLLFLQAIIVVVINQVLGFFVRKLSCYQRHQTCSRFNVSVAFKTTVVLFINTAILPLLTYPNKQDWFVTGGLVTQIFYNTIAISLLQPLFCIFDLQFLTRKARIFQERRKKLRSELTQQQANLLMQGNQFDFPY